MPTISGHLSDRIVNVGAALELHVSIVGGDAGVTFAWQQNNQLVPGANTSTLSVASVTPADAGTWTVVATKGTDVASSTATVVVLDAGPVTIEVPFRWNDPFAWLAALSLGAVTVLVALPLLARASQVTNADAHGGPADAALVATVTAAIGVALLAVAAFAVLVETRGRAKDGTVSAPAVTATEGAAGDVAKAIEALGKLRGAQLVAAAGLLALGASTVLGWRLAGDSTTPATTTTAKPTPSVSTTAKPTPSTSTSVSTSAGVSPSRSTTRGPASP